VPPLRALVEAGHDVALVVTRPDKRRGRGGALVPSAVKAAAIDLGIPVTEQVDDVLDVGADLGVVVAFGRIIKPHIIEALPLVNIHFSLLPRWRGAAPVERAILAGDTHTGVCLMTIEEELDTGAVYDREVIDIGPDETADELRARLIEVGTRLLIENLERGLGTPVSQEGEATYAAKIDPAELQIDWSSPAEDIHRLVRIGGAWTTFRDKRLKVHRTKLTDDGELEIVEVQPEGKGRQPYEAWRNGARLQSGEWFG